MLWFGVYIVALNAGEQHVDAGTAAMLIQLAPILIGVLAGLLLGEGFPRMLVIGGLVAFAGTLLIGVATSTGHADLGGVLLVLLAAVVYAVAVVAQKVVLRRIPGLQVTWLACPDRHGGLPAVHCPSLITDVGNASVGATARHDLSRRGADRGGLPDLGLRAGPQRRRAAGCDHLRGTADRHRARLDLPRTRCRRCWPSSAASISLIGVGDRPAAGQATCRGSAELSARLLAVS